MNQAVLSFNNGEVTPYLRHRIDFEKTGSSAELMENFLPSPIGAAIKRPGLQHITTVTHDTTKGTMVPFVSSDGTAYLLCIDEANGITVLLASTGAVKAVVPYLADSTIQKNFVSGTHSMRELQVKAVNDVAFLTHPQIAPTRLTRNSDTNWTLSAIPFTYYPFSDENTNESATITVAEASVTATAWNSTAGNYNLGDIVSYGGFSWICTFTHAKGATKYPVSGDTIFGGTIPDGYYLFATSSIGVTTYKPIWQKKRPLAIGTSLAVTAAVSTFNSSMVGSRMRFSRPRTADESQISIQLTNADKTSFYIYVETKWNISTFGSWAGYLYLEKSKDGTTWEKYRNYYGSLNRNINDSGELDSPGFLRLRWSYEGAGSSSPTAVLECLDSYIEGFFEISAYTSATAVTATAKSIIFADTSYLWTEAAFTKNKGFPCACTLHENRLVFGGTTSQPTTVWISQADDLLNFRNGTDDSDAITSTLAAPVSNPIRWLESQRRLFIGMARDEYVSGSETLDQPISPSNFTARRYTNTGSRRRRPLAYADGILFAGRNGGRLHEITYNSERGSYSADDLSRLAEHLTKPGISNMAYQQTREPSIWVVREDGVLLNFLYSRNERIAAWSQHKTTNGLFKDVAVIPNDTGDDDVFFLILRGSTTCLERFRAGWQSAQENNSDWLAVDGTIGTGTTITIPTHLRNTPITRLLSGDTAPVASSQTYTTGTATIASQDWQVGFPIVANYVSLPLDFSGRDGSTQSRRKRPHKISLSLYKARGGKVWNRNKNAAQEIPNTQPTAVLRDGWEDVIPDAGHLDDMQLRIIHDDPFPFSLRAVLIRWQLHEG